MKKRAVLFSLVVLLSLIFASGALAKPKTPIIIETLTYDATVVNAGKKGLVLWATGLGTINCNGLAACEAAGLDGEPMNFTQVFVLGFNPGSGSSKGDFKSRHGGPVQSRVWRG